MADGKVLTNETKELIVKAADDAVKLPFYLEIVDGAAFKLILNVIDKKADKVVPDEVDALLNEGIKLVFAGNIDAGAEKLGTALNLVINVPYLDEDTEQAVCVEGMRFLITLLLDWAKKKDNG